MIVKEECPTFDMIKVQSVILSYVVAEGHQEETGRQLIDWYLFEHGGQRAEVVTSFLDLIAKGMLGIDGEKVVRFRMDHVAQAAVVSYALIDGHDGETVAELTDKLTPDGNDGSIERAVRALEQTGVAAIGEGGEVALGETDDPEVQEG